MMKLSAILSTAILCSCAASDPPDEPAAPERWRIAVNVAGQDIDLPFAVPADQVTVERTRAGQFFAHVSTLGGDGDLGFRVQLFAGDELVGSAALATDVAGVDHLMSHAQFLVSALENHDEDSQSLLCAPVGWCDDLPGNCWCLCICGCKCVYWE